MTDDQSAPRRRSAARSAALAAANGLDLRRLARATTGLARFGSEWWHYRRQCRAVGIPRPAAADIFPVTADRLEQAGQIGGHYFHQDLWAATKVFRARPEVHLDVGSRVDGFVAHLLVFRSVVAVDIRPLDQHVPGLTWVQDDARTLSSFADGSMPSVSSLHALEHIGLGRYGDDLDPDGWRLAATSLQRVTAPGGTLYVGVPIGRERTCFNAHRVFDPGTVIAAFDDCTLAEFSVVADDGHLVVDADPAHFRRADYACGLFELRRREPGAGPPTERMASA